MEVTHRWRGKTGEATLECFPRRGQTALITGAELVHSSFTEGAPIDGSVTLLTYKLKGTGLDPVTLSQQKGPPACGGLPRLFGLCCSA